MTPREILLDLFHACVAAADPELTALHLPAPPLGRTLLLAAGKAAAAMARSVEVHWPGQIEGVAITRYGHGVPCNRIEVIEAGHPHPDRVGHAAAAGILSKVQGLTADDLLLCLLSGGGSALLAAPGVGLTLEDKQMVTRALLRSGATISDINCVRKHMSSIKGGRLAAAAYPAKVVSLLISDVPGDDPSVIASGPTTADPTTIADALRILDRCEISLPPATRAAIAALPETPKPGDERLARSDVRIIATPALALEAAVDRAKALGLNAVLLGDDIEGEAQSVGEAHAALARASGSAIILSGGETSVTVQGLGRGGRNTEYLLSLAVALDGEPDVWAIACDTDGIDGSEDNAGAFIAPDTLARGRALGLDARVFLHGNDSYSYFERLGDLIVTGPTRTNVNDFRAIFVGEMHAGH